MRARSLGGGITTTTIMKSRRSGISGTIMMGTITAMTTIIMTMTMRMSIMASTCIMLSGRLI
ncbi:hypothetical protein D3C87_2184920 [compost metagenome]